MPRLLPTFAAALIVVGTLAACSTPAAPPEETAAPAPTESTPAAEDWLASFGEFAPETHSGSGITEIELPEGVTGGIVTATYTGDSNFRISPRDAANEPSEGNLVNHVGSYTGTTVWGLSHDDITVLLVEAESGEYEITIAPMSSAPEFSVPASGDSDAVFTSDLDAASYLLRNLDGERPVTVAVETESGGENARAEPNESGALVLPGGIALIVVRAEMIPWEITR